jgi:hypothetical protein
VLPVFSDSALATFTTASGGFGRGRSYLRRALICSIFSGRSSAKRSFNVCTPSCTVSG